MANENSNEPPESLPEDSCLHKPECHLSELPDKLNWGTKIGTVVLPANTYSVKVKFPANSKQPSFNGKFLSDEPIKLGSTLALKEDKDSPTNQYFGKVVGIVKSGEKIIVKTDISGVNCPIFIISVPPEIQKQTKVILEITPEKGWRDALFRLFKGDKKKTPKQIPPSTS